MSPCFSCLYVFSSWILSWRKTGSIQEDAFCRQECRTSIFIVKAVKYYAGSSLFLRKRDWFSYFCSLFAFLPLLGNTSTGVGKKTKATKLWGRRGIPRQLAAQLAAKLPVSTLALIIIRQAHGLRIIFASQTSQRFLLLSQSPGGLVHGAVLLLPAGFGGCFLLVWDV